MRTSSGIPVSNTYLAKAAAKKLSRNSLSDNPFWIGLTAKFFNCFLGLSSARDFNQRPHENNHGAAAFFYDVEVSR